MNLKKKPMSNINKIETQKNKGGKLLSLQKLDLKDLNIDKNKFWTEPKSKKN